MDYQNNKYDCIVVGAGHAGCEAAILACTELSVVKKELDLPEYYRDPMEIMADRCIEYYRAIGEIK